LVDLALEHAFQLVGNTLLISLVVPLVVFIVMYAVRSPWRENELGIALMFQKIGLALLVSVIIGANFVPADWNLGRVIARGLALGTVLFLLSVDVLNLWRYQNGRRNRLVLFGKLMYQPPPVSPRKLRRDS